jgi:hypothetical protein
MTVTVSSRVEVFVGLDTSLFMVLIGPHPEILGCDSRCASVLSPVYTCSSLAYKHTEHLISFTGHFQTLICLHMYIVSLCTVAQLHKIKQSNHYILIASCSMWLPMSRIHKYWHVNLRCIKFHVGLDFHKVVSACVLLLCVCVVLFCFGITFNIFFSRLLHNLWR